MHHADTPVSHDIRVFFKTGELDGERGAWFFASRRDHEVYIRGGKPHCANTKLDGGMVFIPVRRMPTIIIGGCSMQPDLRANPDSEAAEWQRRHYQIGARELGLAID
jgi:hypothetical protein